MDTFFLLHSVQSTLLVLYIRSSIVIYILMEKTSILSMKYFYHNS